MFSGSENTTNASSLCIDYYKTYQRENESDPTSASGSQALSVLGTVLMSILSLLILAGNGLIIISIAVVKKLRQPANYLIVSLALSDFLVGFMVLPLTIVYDAGGEWVFGFVMCDVHVSFDVICCTASIMNLCMISIDRYWIITRPLTYPKQRNGKLMLVYIIAAWLLSALIILPALFGFTQNVKDAPDWIQLSAPSAVVEESPLNDSAANNHTAWKAIDRNFSTYWDPGPNAKNWDLTLDLQQVYKVKKVRIKSSEKTSNDVNFFSIKTDLCSVHFSDQINETFLTDNHSLGQERVYELKYNVAARLVRLTLHRSQFTKQPHVHEFAVYGEKLTGKTCLISQEVWFTIYSTLGAFYLPLLVMLFMYWRIFVEAARFNARHRQRSTSYPGSQENYSTSLIPQPPSRNRLSLSSASEPRDTNYYRKYKNSIECEQNHKLNFDAKSLKSCQDSPGDCDKTKEEGSPLLFADCYDLNMKTGISHSRSEENVDTDKSYNTRADDGVNQVAHEVVASNGHTPNLSCTNLSKSNSNNNDLDKCVETINHFQINEENSKRFATIAEDDVLELDTSAHKPGTAFRGKNARIIYTRSNSDVTESQTKTFQNKKDLHSYRTSSIKQPFSRSFSNPGRTFTISHQETSRVGEISRSSSYTFSKSNQHDEWEICDCDSKRSSRLSSFRRRMSSTSSNRERLRNKKATKTLGVIVGAFTFCWLPFFIVTFMRPFVCDEPESQDCMPFSLVRAVLWLGYVNSALNPLIYIGYSPDLKDTFRYLLHCKCSNIDREIARSELEKATLNEKRASLKSNVLLHRSTHLI